MKKVILVTLIFVFLAGCSGANKAQKGAGIGALGGALIGSHVGPEDEGSRLRNAAIGAGIGTIFGYIIGNELDKYDKRQISKTLEKTPDNETTSWKNPNNGNRYQATPQKTRTTGERPVREVRIRADTDNDGNFDETIMAEAERQPNGQWKLEQ